MALMLAWERSPSSSVRRQPREAFGHEADESDHDDGGYDDVFDHAEPRITLTNKRLEAFRHLMKCLDRMLWVLQRRHVPEEEVRASKTALQGLLWTGSLIGFVG